MTCRKMIKADDVRSMLTKMLDDISEGHTFVITKYGKPIAELGPVKIEVDDDEHPAAQGDARIDSFGTTTSSSTHADTVATTSPVGTAGAMTRDGLLREANAAGSRRGR